MTTGAETRMWSVLRLENWKRVNELRQAQADNRVLKQLYREATRRKHGAPLPFPQSVTQPKHQETHE